jgi:hypothetical protein
MAPPEYPLSGGGGTHSNNGSPERTLSRQDSGSDYQFKMSAPSSTAPAEASPMQNMGGPQRPRNYNSQSSDSISLTGQPPSQVKSVSGVDRFSYAKMKNAYFGGGDANALATPPRPREGGNSTEPVTSMVRQVYI